MNTYYKVSSFFSIWLRWRNSVFGLWRQTAVYVQKDKTATTHSTYLMSVFTNSVKIIIKTVYNFCHTLYDFIYLYFYYMKLLCLSLSSKFNYIWLKVIYKGMRREFKVICLTHFWPSHKIGNPVIFLILNLRCFINMLNSTKQF